MNDGDTLRYIDSVKAKTRSTQFVLIVTDILVGSGEQEGRGSGQDGRERAHLLPK